MVTAASKASGPGQPVCPGPGDQHPPPEAVSSSRGPQHTVGLPSPAEGAISRGSPHRTLEMQIILTYPMARWPTASLHLREGAERRLAPLGVRGIQPPPLASQTEEEGQEPGPVAASGRWQRQGFLEPPERNSPAGARVSAHALRSSVCVVSSY